MNITATILRNICNKYLRCAYLMDIVYDCLVDFNLKGQLWIVEINQGHLYISTMYFYSSSKIFVIEITKNKKWFLYNIP